MKKQAIRFVMLSCFPVNIVHFNQHPSSPLHHFFQLVCDRDEELYELNKDSTATISGLKSQLLSSNKAHTMLEKNHHDLEINLRKVIQNKSQKRLDIEHAKAKTGREADSTMIEVKEAFEKSK